MKIEGSYTFQAPRDVVWQALQDPDVLVKVMPGCERLEAIGEHEYQGAMKIRVGPMQGAFDGKIALADLTPPETYRMKVNGNGPLGFVNGEGQVRLESQDGVTVMHYEGEAQVGGRVASVGQRLLDSSARALTQQSLDGLNQQILARLQAQTVHAPPPVIEAPSQVEFAAGVARNLLDEWLPADKRPQLLTIGLAVLASLFVLRILDNWRINRIARKVADELWKKEVRAKKG
ncbi:MAG: carbon monoxide dehydrogenase subunit G [Chloroflexota bacterium]